MLLVSSARTGLTARLSALKPDCTDLSPSHLHTAEDFPGCVVRKCQLLKPSFHFTWKPNDALIVAYEPALRWWEVFLFLFFFGSPSTHAINSDFH